MPISWESGKPPTSKAIACRSPGRPRSGVLGRSRSGSLSPFIARSHACSRPGRVGVVLVQETAETISSRDLFEVKCGLGFGVVGWSGPAGRSQ
jgi:hypothetical protein